LKEGLIKTIGWYLDNPGWVDKIRKHQEYQSWVKDNYQDRGNS